MNNELNSLSRNWTCGIRIKRDSGDLYIGICLARGFDDPGHDDIVFGDIPDISTGKHPCWSRHSLQMKFCDNSKKARTTSPSAPEQIRINCFTAIYRFSISSYNLHSNNVLCSPSPRTTIPSNSALQSSISFA